MSIPRRLPPHLRAITTGLLLAGFLGASTEIKAAQHPCSQLQRPSASITNVADGPRWLTDALRLVSSLFVPKDLGEITTENKPPSGPPRPGLPQDPPRNPLPRPAV